MFILFRGHQTRKDYGPTLPMKCLNCKDDVWLRLVNIKTWFTIFFIPVFPYKWEYYLLCNICSQGVKLEPWQIDKAKGLNRYTISFLNKEINQREYNKYLDDFKLSEEDNLRIRKRELLK